MLYSNHNFLFLFFFFHLQSLLLPALCGSNETDIQALLAFKAAVVSDPLHALSSWNETVHFCSWRGVVCGPKHGDRVVSIQLMSQGLVGLLPPHIGNLSFLRRINIRNNSFHGHIPEDIGRLRRLEYVEFSNNSFDGEIPRNISQCQNLHYLNLIDNKLVGRIIPEIGLLVKLRALGLTTNRLSGTLPPWIGNLTSLEILSLANCGLTGQIPESLVQLRNLNWFQVSENSLTGTIPSGLFNSSISMFSVRFNHLEGTLPFDAGYTLRNIRLLDLWSNNFSGEIPSSLSNASSLEGINLASNNFVGPMMSFERLPNLVRVAMSQNNLTGDVSFISSLRNCTKLEVFGVDENLFSGSLPDSIANLSQKLTFFSMAGNNIHGQLPSGIGNLVNLGFLSLSHNYLSGPIPSSVGNLVKLQELHLEVNRFIGDMQPSLGNLSLLNHLFLGYNNISGTVPESFNKFRQLLTLDLSHNNMNGAIPPEIFSISSISISFSLAYNEFVGPIPSEVGNLINLGDLDLSNNRLSGSIPNALSRCVSLQRLHLQGNSLDGGIPTALASLRGLQELDLSQNQLLGPIPSFVGELHLLHLNLSFNKLHGPVPTLGVFRNQSSISVDGNNDLCGGIPELRLKSCPTSNPQKGNMSKRLKIIVPISVVGVAFSLILVFLCVFVRKRKTKAKSRDSMSISDQHFMRLSYADLVKATNGFSSANFIGAGRFGSVYKGILKDGITMVAVKVLNLDVKGASKTFVAECNALRGIRHRNLVKLLSVCLSTDFQGRDFKALVYEYKSNGSLEAWLHHNGEKPGKDLTMIRKLSIAIDVASALEYLHFGTHSTIIHGDLKPSNILLDDDMTAYIGDFGLAKVVSSISKDFPATENSSLGVRGTIGYIAPEYGLGDMVSTQGDAYSFGILLLEMFTNLTPTDEAFKDHSNLHTFVASALAKNSTMDILDPFIVQEIKSSDDKKSMDCMESVLRIGVACSNEFPRDRMAMTDVVIELNRTRRAYSS